MPRPNLNPRPVILPGGRHLSSQLHLVKPGEIIRRGKGYTEKVSSLGKVVFHQTDDTPLVSKLGQIANSSPNWVADAAWKNDSGAPVQHFATKWKVPDPPVDQCGQVIYLFNGMDPLDSGLAILQPVLQWGFSPSGGGEYWSVATYYVAGNGPAFSTDAVVVNPGDVLQGVIKLVDQDTSGFNYIAEFAGIPNSVLRASGVQELIWCYETLETYGAATSNACYPADPFTTFSSICIETAAGNPTVQWVAQTGGSNNGQHVGNINNSSVSGQMNIYYR